MRGRKTTKRGIGEATDSAHSTRCPVSLSQDNAPQWHQVKPDPETNPLADLDCEKMPRWDEQTVQAIPLRASTCAGS